MKPALGIEQTVIPGRHDAVPVLVVVPLHELHRPLGYALDTWWLMAAPVADNNCGSLP